MAHGNLYAGCSQLLNLYHFFTHGILYFRYRSASGVHNSRHSRHRRPGRNLWQHIDHYRHAERRVYRQRGTIGLHHFRSQWSAASAHFQFRFDEPRRHYWERRRNGHSNNPYDCAGQRGLVPSGASPGSVGHTRWRCSCLPSVVLDSTNPARSAKHAWHTGAAAGVDHRITRVWRRSNRERWWGCKRLSPSGHDRGDLHGDGIWQFRHNNVNEHDHAGRAIAICDSGAQKKRPPNRPPDAIPGEAVRRARSRNHRKRYPSHRQPGIRPPGSTPKAHLLGPTFNLDLRPNTVKVSSGTNQPRPG